MWPQLAKFCPVCGAVLTLVEIEGRERPKCGSCSFVQFRNPASAAAGVVLDSRGRLLLIKRRIEPYRGDWAVPAGYQEIDEDLRETVVREVFEETGIRSEVERLIDLVWMPSDHRKPANVAFFLCRATGGELSAADDAEDARWFARDEFPENIGFDNREFLLAHLPD